MIRGGGSKWLLVLGALLPGCAYAGVGAQSPETQFDGTFLLETGEVVTGGYFVEGGQGRFFYMDTEGLARGGLFERVGPASLRAIVPPGARIEFGGWGGEVPDTLRWIDPAGDTVRGVRIQPHDSRTVRFRSADGTPLTGRLLTPRCPGPHPVVVSVHGSGPVDRHAGPYHTFFLRHGMAVLAYDKRGYGSEPWREPNLEDLSADAAAAVRFAAAQPGLDDRIGLFGSSQAGWVVPRAAAEAPEVRFMILRAGAALTGAETVIHEVRQELRAAGVRGIELDHAVDLLRAVYAVAMEGKPISATDALVRPYLGEPWYREGFGEGLISETWSARSWERLRQNVGIAGTTAVRSFDGPVLWFLAEQDENVPLVSTRVALEQAFRASPGNDQEVVVLEGALHSFLVPRPDGPPRFVDGFFDRMGTWLRDRNLADGECWGPQE